MRTKVAALGVGLAFGLEHGCLNRQPEAPVVNSVEPDIALVGESPPIVIRGEFYLDAYASFKDTSRSHLGTLFTVWLDQTKLAGVEYVDSSELRAVVPVGLTIGLHDLTVEDPAGRKGTLPNAFAVLASATSCTSDGDCVAVDQCHDPGTCNLATGLCNNPSKPDNTNCDDGTACTSGETCQLGVCGSPTDSVMCTALDQCHDPGACDPATGLCSNPLKANGTTCDDGVSCTSGESCQDGACSPATESCFGSPPLARFTRTPALITINQSVSFDASLSSDAETPAANLDVSWDFLGNAATTPGTAPWTAWSTTKAASYLYVTAASRTVRLAVRDADGNIGYGSALVVVLKDNKELCMVDTNTDVDNGTRCGEAGLSLREAVDDANALGKQTIAFTSPMSIALSSNLTITDVMDVVAPDGLVLTGGGLVVNAGAGDLVSITGLEMTGQTTAINVVAGIVVLRDLYLHDVGTGVQVGAGTTITGTRIITTAGSAIRASASLTLRYSELRGALGNAGLEVAACPLGTVIDIQSSLFIENAVGGWLAAACDGSLIRHNTFQDNSAQGLLYTGGSGHVLRNNIFSSNGAEAFLAGGGATFAAQDYHLVFQNNDPGCGTGCTLGANTITADPVYTFANSFDLRLLPTSPAVDSAVDLGVDTNGAAPGSFFGSGPDRGGRETW